MDIFKRRKLEQAGADGAAGGGPAGGAKGPATLIDTAVKGGEGAAGGAQGGEAAKGGQGEGAPGEWFWSEGVKGADKPPDWYDGKKYKSVAEQAKAYPEARRELDGLRTKLKGFGGAPEKYELSMPDDLKEAASWSEGDPLLGEFQKFARDKGMDQGTFTGLLHMLAKYEYTQETVDLAAEKTALGERADARLTGFHEWAAANLSEEQLAAVMQPLGRTSRPSDVFKAMEIVLAATRQPAISKPGDDTHTTQTVAEVDAMYAKTNDKGQRLVDIDPGYLKKCREARRSVVGEGDHIEIVGKRKAG